MDWNLLCQNVSAHIITSLSFITSVLCAVQFFLILKLILFGGKVDLFNVFTSVLLQENCMVCGIDCFHDTTTKGGSVAGFVASLNQTFTRWFSKVCFQGHAQELVDGLKTCFISALKCYYDVSIELIWMCVVFNFGVPVTVHGISSDCACKREILHVGSRCRYSKTSSRHIWKIWKNLAQ